MLVFVEAGLSVLAAALLPLQRGYFLAAMRQSMPQQPQPVSFDVAPIVTATIYSSMVFALAGAVLWIVLGVKVRQGRNWARIVVTVLAGLALVSVLVSLIQLISPAHLPIYSYAVSAAGALIDIALLILLWRQPAAGWFNARTAYRRQQRYLRRPS